MADGYTMDPAIGSQSFYDEQIQFLHKLWGKSVDPWCVKGADDKFIFANDAYLDFLGVPPGTSVLGILEKKLLSSLDGRQSINLYSNVSNSCLFPSQERSSFILRSMNRSSKSVKFLYIDKYPLLDLRGKVYATCFHGRYDFLLSLSMFHHRSNATCVKTVPPTEAFTEREWEVLYFLQQGFSRTEIANLLNISPGTIKIHINHLYKKTKTSSYPDFIKLCSKYDLLDYIPEKFFIRLL